MFFEDGKVGPVPYFFAGVGAFAGCAITFSTMLLHLKNYRRPDLQRLAIRILWMVPVYAVASFVSLSSRYASDYIDTIRDIYEGFVIYSFFLLCINYLGGERSLLAVLDERMRTHHLWPFNLCFAPMDMSDPDTFLFVRRGVLQFVVLKPILSIVTMALKLGDAYHEGSIAWDSGYLWLSALYNLSVCWSLYCLVLFYVQCSKDLKPYRPMPKFVCVKSIVFLTFYQGLGVAFLVWAGVIHDSEGYSSAHFALALQDFLICLEMPFLALLHRYAFPWTDYNDRRLSSRVPL
ncbi:organic solute transporter subunit alpha/Transmembrane protein [Geranomyces variabilis]|nr:organic solute transporter subunit alpha/Transmembrane protein [Geranomyces variabilis]